MQSEREASVKSCEGCEGVEQSVKCNVKRCEASVKRVREVCEGYAKARRIPVHRLRVHICVQNL